MQTKLYPMKLLGVTKSPIWGGTRLCREYGKQSSAKTVGESWELTVRRDEISTVENGVFSGKGLDEVIGLCGRDVTGGDFGVSDFPLLVKLIDADDRLSVQVHPDDVYAARVENDRGKTEMWYIVDAAEGAEIICGLADGVDSKDFAKAVAEGRVESVLRHLPVAAGEAYFIPAGLAHAIGKGILIAEIQQNCDLTYRVYDYCRRDADGKLRELHIERALDVTRPFCEDEINAVRFSQARGEERDQDELLAACDFFRVKKIELCKDTRELGRRGVMQHLLLLSDGLTLHCDGVMYPTKKGESWLLPAALDGALLVGEGSALLTSVR